MFFRIRPWLILLLFPLFFRVSASASSVFFRVRPWLMLLLCQPSLTLPALISVFFRVRPWLILLLLFLY